VSYLPLGCDILNCFKIKGKKETNKRFMNSNILYKCLRSNDFGKTLNEHLLKEQTIFQTRYKQTTFICDAYTNEKRYVCFFGRSTCERNEHVIRIDGRLGHNFQLTNKIPSGNCSETKSDFWTWVTVGVIILSFTSSHLEGAYRST